MNFLRILFGLRAIYFKQTAIEIITVYGVIGVVLWVLPSTGGVSHTQLHIIWALTAIAAYMCLRSVARTLIVNSYLLKHPATVVMSSPNEMASSSANLELDGVDNTRTLATYGDANLFMTMFNFYRHTKYGDYLGKQAYYLVLEVPLQRILPHILFDSKVAKRRQFHYTYLKVQRIHVQGPFDDVFDTYVPETYAIDSLSFVSPEVMEVLLDARAYDIEIINDKLLLYAPLLDDAGIATMVAKARIIAKELDDNIDTYRDDRLTGLARETNVTYFARSLLRSPLKNLVVASLLSVVTVGIIVAACMYPSSAGDILMNQISILVYLTLIMNAWRAASIGRANKRALANFHILYETNRGKPITQGSATPVGNQPGQ